MARGRDTISQRIALEGGDDIKRQLKDLGDTGEQAFKQISDATQANSSGLDRISTFVSGLKGHFSNLKAGIEPTVENFKKLTDAGKDFAASLEKTANNLIPNFRTVTELALAGSVAGFIELAKRAADAAENIENASERTGLTTTAFQGLSFAAAKAGVDSDKLVGVIAKLNKSIGDAAEKQKGDLLGIAKDVFSNVEVSGNTVLNGLNKTAKQASDAIRSPLITFDAAAKDKILPFANQLKGVFDAINGGTSSKTLQQINNELLIASNRTDKVGEEIRSLAGIKPKTAPEAFQQLKDAGDDVIKRLRLMGVAIQDQDGNIRPLEEILGDLAEAYKNTSDKTAFASTAAKIMGRDFKALIPVLKDGREGFKEAATELTRLGVSFDPLSLKVGVELRGAFESLEIGIKNIVNLFVLGFAPVIQPILEEISSLIKDNATEITNFSKSLAADAKPAVEDLIKILRGASSDDLTTKWAKDLKSFLDALPASFAVLSAAVSAILAPFNALAAAINLITGSQLSGWMIAAGVAVLSLTGLLGTLTSAFRLMWAAAAVVAGVIGWPATLVLGLILLFGWIGKITGAWDDVGAAVGRMVNWTLEQIGWIINKAGELAAYLLGGLTEAWNGLGSTVGKVVNSVLEQIGWVINKLGEWATAAAEAINAQSELGDLSGNPFNSGVGLASGGQVWGPAGHDRVPARLTRGEFVQRVAAVRHYGVGFMSKINRLELPKNGILGFAMGGLVGAPAASLSGDSGITGSGSLDRVSVDLTFNGERFADMLAPRTVATKLVSFARGQKVRSAGTKPSWVT